MYNLSTFFLSFWTIFARLLTFLCLFLLPILPCVVTRCVNGFAISIIIIFCWNCFDSGLNGKTNKQLIAQVPLLTSGATQKPLFHLHRKKKKAAAIFSRSVFGCAFIKGLINLKWINSVNTWELFCSKSRRTSKELFVTLNYSLNRWLMSLVWAESGSLLPQPLPSGKCK